MSRVSIQLSVVPGNYISIIGFMNTKNDSINKVIKQIKQTKDAFKEQSMLKLVGLRPSLMVVIGLQENHPIIEGKFFFFPEKLNNSG